MTNFIKSIFKIFISFLLLISVISCSKSANKSNPESAEAHYNRGLELLRLNDSDNAKREFRFAIELDAHFAPAHLGLAILNYNQKDYSTSEYHVDEAIKLKKHWVDAYLLKSKILFQKEQYDEALEILKQSEDIFNNGNNRKALKSEIYFWQGLCLKNMSNYDMAAIAFSAVLKLDPENHRAKQALDDIRLISEMIATYPQSIKDIINKKAIKRKDWAELLMKGLSKNFILNTSIKNINSDIKLPEDNSTESIIRAVQKNLVNVYPDGEFKPDLDLSWAEVIITAKNIFQAIKNQKSSQMSTPPFTDLPDLHPLYESAALATTLGIFKNLSQPTYRLSQSVTGLDALHIIANLNKVINQSL